MRIWYDKAYKPYIGTVSSTSGLLLDDFVCHNSGELTQRLNSDNYLLYVIPPIYTGLLQPCDVGINKSLKDRMKKAAALGDVIVAECLRLEIIYLLRNLLTF